MKITCLGTGDAFASGGRNHTAFLLEHDGARALLDCGATTLTALRRQGISPAAIDTILLSHLHGDHFGGLPFLLMDACYNEPRQRPLTIAGPPGHQRRVMETIRCLYPDSPPKIEAQVEIVWRELHDRVVLELASLKVTPFLVAHPSGAPPYALRVEMGGRTIAFSGDTAWTPSLVAAADGVDLLLCECSSFDKPLPSHLRYSELQAQLPYLRASRIVLTHLGPDALANRDRIELEVAEDGQVIEV